ncbi:hypothetical protein GCM10027051_14610 [Niabella terrae]
MVINAQAQGTPLYLSQKTPPPTTLLLADSVTKWPLKARYAKNKQLFIMLFNPDCDHCQHETEALIKNISKFKDIQIVMATTKSISEMKAFIKRYGLNKYSNITVGRDIAYVIPSYYEVKNLPYLAFYDKNKRLISTFEGSLGMGAILKIFGK